MYKYIYIIRLKVKKPKNLQRLLTLKQLSARRLGEAERPFGRRDEGGGH
jgi:hypothetical protein